MWGGGGGGGAAKWGACRHNTYVMLDPSALTHFRPRLSECISCGCTPNTTTHAPVRRLFATARPATDTTDVVSSSIRLSGLFSKHVVDLPEEARASLRVRGRRGPITLGNQYINPI